MISKPKQTAVSLLRQTHLLRLADYLRYVWDLKKNCGSNKEFAEKNPNFRLPPSDLAYDAYGHTNWHAYYCTGKEQAQYISTLIKEHTDKHSLKICEWGCGAARLLRHMRYFFADRSVDLYGFDYNSRTINWCRQNIENITFGSNSLAPPLPYESDEFDCLYCLSVFTHLSQEMHFQWIKELSRVVKPDGLIILTTHGDVFREKLLNNEIRSYDEGNLVVRGNIKEGKRCFVAYHPPSFVRNKLLEGLFVISHLTDPIPQNLMQDIWVVRNTKNLSASYDGLLPDQCRSHIS